MELDIGKPTLWCTSNSCGCGFHQKNFGCFRQRVGGGREGAVLRDSSMDAVEDRVLQLGGGQRYKFCKVCFRTTISSQLFSILLMTPPPP